MPGLFRKRELVLVKLWLKQRFNITIRSGLFVIRVVDVFMTSFGRCVMMMKRVGNELIEA